MFSSNPNGLKFPKPPWNPTPPKHPGKPKPPGPGSDTLLNDRLGKLIKKLGGKK